MTLIVLTSLPAAGQQIAGLIVQPHGRTTATPIMLIAMVYCDPAVRVEKTGFMFTLHASGGGGVCLAAASPKLIFHEALPAGHYTVHERYFDFEDNTQKTGFLAEFDVLPAPHVSVFDPRQLVLIAIALCGTGFVYLRRS